MAIIAASIEPNGWVLALTLTGGLGNFASYTLDPDGTPRLSIASSHPGYQPLQGGGVTATNRSRTLVATKPLRKPAEVVGVTLQPAVIDEADLGGGQIRVRIALSEHFYAGDTGLVLTALAGWRSGEGAATIAVTNGSTMVAPMPIARWLDVPYQRRTGPFKLTLGVFSHHPQGLTPVAAVRFTVFDNTTLKTFWAMGLATSTTYGDALRTYEVSVDPALAPALSAGLLRCDFEIYPWIGAVRTSNPNGAGANPPMSAMSTAGYATPADTPFLVAWDPAGTRYPPAYVVIDGANGTGTASAAMVQPTLAAAKAVAPAAKPNRLSVAIQALYLANRNAAAANGQPALTRMLDGATIVVPADNAQVFPGSASVTSTVTTSEAWLDIVGDPDAADPRANARVSAVTTAAAGVFISRVRFANLTVELSTRNIFTGSTRFWWFDNVEMRGNAGLEGTCANPAGATSTAIYFTRSRVWRTQFGASYASNYFPYLVRACEFSKRAEAMAIVSSKWIEPLDTSINSAGTPSASARVVGGWNNQNSVANAGAMFDVVIAGNDLRSTRNRVLAPPMCTAAAGGTPNPSCQRLAFVNNLCERYGSYGEPFFSIGEGGGQIQASYNIFEGNSFIGERCNYIYSDPDPLTLAETWTVLNTAFVNRVANNAYDWQPTKHDTYNDTDTLAVRQANGGPLHGYRPQMVEAWSHIYGVGHEGNVDLSRAPSAPQFRPEYFGLRSTQYNSSTSPQFASDRSRYGNGAGGGDYTPLTGSPLRGRGRSANVDTDLFGIVRSIPFAAGAVDAVTVVAVTPAGGRCATRSGAGQLSWKGQLGPVRAALAVRDAGAALRWAGALSPAGAVLATRSDAGLLILGTPPLAPARGVRAVFDQSAALLRPALGPAALRTVQITGDFTISEVPPEPAATPAGTP